jgi:hypothetical protein
VRCGNQVGLTIADNILQGGVGRTLQLWLRLDFELDICCVIETSLLAFFEGNSYLNCFFLLLNQSFRLFFYLQQFLSMKLLVLIF